MSAERRPLLQRFERAVEELKFVGIECSLDGLRKSWRNREDSGTRDRQEEVRSAGNPAIAAERWSATGHDAMQVRMKLEVLSPTVQRRQRENRSPHRGVGDRPRWFSGSRLWSGRGCCRQSPCSGERSRQFPSGTVKTRHESKERQEVRPWRSFNPLGSGRGLRHFGQWRSRHELKAFHVHGRNRRSAPDGRRERQSGTLRWWS